MKGKDEKKDKKLNLKLEETRQILNKTTLPSPVDNFKVKQKLKAKLPEEVRKIKKS